MDSALAIFGAVMGAIGAASGYYAFILSGYRIKSHIGIGIHTFRGAIIKINDQWKGGLGYNIPFVPGSEVLYIQVWNKGRMPVNIDRLTIYQRKNGFFRGTEETGLSLVISESPVESSNMPHRIDFGSSAMWLYPLNDIMALSRLDLEGRRWGIRVRLELGDEKVKKSRNWLFPSKLDEFKKEWTEYVVKNTPRLISEGLIQNPNGTRVGETENSSNN
jgi:hypothetical protein